MRVFCRSLRRVLRVEVADGGALGGGGGVRREGGVDVVRGDVSCKKLTAEDAEERRDTAPLCGLRVPCVDSSGSCFDRLDKDFCTNPLASCPRRRASMPAIAQSSQGEMDSRFRGNDDRGQFGGLMLRRARHEAFTIMNPLPEPEIGRASCSGRVCQYV